jgi:hypothetical protein
MIVFMPFLPVQNRALPYHRQIICESTAEEFAQDSISCSLGFSKGIALGDKEQNER